MTKTKEELLDEELKDISGGKVYDDEPRQSLCPMMICPYTSKAECPYSNNARDCMFNGTSK